MRLPTLYGHFGPRTLRPKDTSAPVFGAEGCTRQPARQTVMNAAARLVCSARKYDHVTL